MISKLSKIFFLTLLATTACSHSLRAWWDNEWTLRKKFTVDTGSSGVAITDNVGNTAVLIRLFDGNFQFLSAKEDGSDIRFLAADEKTPLIYHIERYDALLSEAFVWVKIPDVKPGAQVSFWMYYGNTGEKATAVNDPKGTYDADTVLVYHFAEHAKPPVDSSASANNASTAGNSVEASFIGGGLRLDGAKPFTIPASPSLAWTQAGNLTVSAWIKPNALQPNSVLFSRGESGKSFIVGLDNGIPYVEVNGGGASQRSVAGAVIPTNKWAHLAVTVEGAKVSVYLDGNPYATLAASLPALESPILLGSSGVAGSSGFNGEFDQLTISKTARSAGFLKFEASSQSGDLGAKLLQPSPDEIKEAGTFSHVMEHVMLFGDIAKNMMFDGWVVIFLCGIMAGIGWFVAVKKFLYLRKIKKGSEEFLRQWKTLSSDLTALDHTDTESVKSLGGGATNKAQQLMLLSPLYHIYHIGSEEIRHRLNNKAGFNGLSVRSIQAIKASLDAGLTHEMHRLNDGLIYLTISIAGGPYLGLLGTVIGVMVTFAVIAKSGQVEVNSIAPGIAGALLATVAGLLVAIPALFIYSFLNSQIKDAASDMQMFITEFITKMAEFYPANTPDSLIRSLQSELQQEEASFR